MSLVNVNVNVIGVSMDRKISSDAQLLFVANDHRFDTLSEKPHTRYWCKNGSWGRLTWQLASFIFSESDLALVPTAVVLIKELAEDILLYKYILTFI